MLYISIFIHRDTFPKKLGSFSLVTQGLFSGISQESEKKTPHHKKRHVQYFLYVIFFHDDDVGVKTTQHPLKTSAYINYPSRLSNLEIFEISKLRIRPSMCERKEWPNHLRQGHGDGVGT